MSDAPACASCGAPAPLSCSRCKSAFYCSSDCQKDAYRAHKPDCKRIAASWGRSDELLYGAWTTRASLLLAVRPQYQVLRGGFDGVLVSLDGVLCPLEACVTMTSPALAPGVALEVLALALEARSFARSASALASGRAKRYDTAFNLFKLAASPAIVICASPNLGEMAKPMTKAELVVEADRVAACFDKPRASYSKGPYPTGGNAEAQFRMGQCYAEGLMSVSGGRRLVMPAAYWMVLAAKNGHAKALAWVGMHTSPGS